MTAHVIPFPARPHLRLVEAVREAQYRASVAEGYSPKVLAIPEQKPREWDKSVTADEQDGRNWR